MRLAGSIVTTLGGLLGLIMGIMAYMAIGSIMGDPEMAALMADAGAEFEGMGDMSGMIGGAIKGVMIAGMVIAALVTLMGVLMFSSRSMAIGIVAIVFGVIALFVGGWITMLGGVVGGILFLVGRNS